MALKRISENMINRDLIQKINGKADKTYVDNQFDEVVQARKNSTTLNDRINEIDTEVEQMNQKITLIQNNFDSELTKVLTL